MKETIYGDKAYRARMEIMNVRLNQSRLATEYWQARTQEARDKVMERINANIARLDEIEIRYFGEASDEPDHISRLQAWSKALMNLCLRAIGRSGVKTI